MAGDRAGHSMAWVPGPLGGDIGRYLMSGFVRCGVCGGAYIKTNHSYRCGAHRNLGKQVCSNARGVTVAKLQRVVIDALRERLYTSANLKAVIEEVRNQLAERAKQEERARLAVGPSDQARRLREVEREIDNIRLPCRSGRRRRRC